MCVNASRLTTVLLILLASVSARYSTLNFQSAIEDYEKSFNKKHNDFGYDLQKELDRLESQ